MIPITVANAPGGNDDDEETMSKAQYEIQVSGTADGGGRVPDLSPREAMGRWLSKLRVDRSESTVSTYHYRLKHFVEWAEENQIQSMNEVTGWDVETYETHRREQGLELVSLNNELGTLEDFFRYCARIEVAPEDLPEKVDVPSVSASDEVSKDRLAPDRAKRLLRYYDGNAYGTRAHVVLALEWFTGARMGAIRALDLEDYDRERQSLSFRHRPEEDTPLKNGKDGERLVGLREDVCAILDTYIREYRHDEYDDFGRRPLVTSELGRGSKNGVRGWTYLATVPCHCRDCPHGNERDSCEYLDYTNISKCPSSVNPHAVRRGSITWQLNQGIPPKVVAERVNTSIEVLNRHYDQQSQREELENRRRRYLDRLTFDNGGENK